MAGRRLNVNSDLRCSRVVVLLDLVDVISVVTLAAAEAVVVFSDDELPEYCVSTYFSSKNARSHCEPAGPLTCTGPLKSFAGVPNTPPIDRNSLTEFGCLICSA